VLLLQPCPENTVTCDQPLPGNQCTGPALFDSPDSCLAKPGYCWANSVASKAPVGYFKVGYNQDDCTACGTGLTTAQTASQSPVDCVPLPGWEKDTPNMAYATPCLLGWYSAGGDSAVKCAQCAQGSTTEFPMSNDISQCSVCSPGWGGYTTNGVTTCNLCSVGTYSPGGTDNPCISCQDGETSPPGASDSSDCFDTFGSFGE
jgi:hypothetical protein